MSLSWWHGLVNRGTLKLKSSAARRLGRRRTESRRILFEPLEPRVLLASNPYINLSNGVANSFTAGQDTWVQIPVRVDNLQDSLGDVGLRSATVELSFSTTALIASAPGRGATESGNTVTITTQAAHNFVVGEAVTITGVNNPVYDGTFTIASVSTTAFTYTDSAHANLPSSGAGAATASFFDQGPVQSVASALGNPTDYAPVVAQGPLVPSTWSFGTGQGAGTIEIATQSPNAADDVTTTDPTNGGTSPDGDILAYVFLHVIHGTSPLPTFRSTSLIQAARCLRTPRAIP
jgi:hypothetical protein